MTDQQISGFGGERKVGLGTCLVLLTPLLPWLNENERAAVRICFMWMNKKTLHLDQS